MEKEISKILTILFYLTIQINSPSFAESIATPDQKNQIIAIESIQQLKMLNPEKYNTVHVLYFSKKGDDGGGLFQWDSANTNPDDNGLVIDSNYKQNIKGRWIRILEHPYLSPTYWGADKSGMQDSYLPLTLWINACQKYKKNCYLPSGNYISSKQLKINLSPSARDGVFFYGDGGRKSVIKFTTLLAPNLLIYCSDCKDAFYFKIADIGLEGSATGPILQLGKSDFSDALNSFTVENITVSNNNKNNLASAVELNYVVSSRINITANNSMHGDAIKLKSVQMSTISGSYGNADIGIHLTNGYNFGNVFLNTDIEATKVNIRIDSETSRNNTFIGGQYVWDDYAIENIQGDNNIFINPNLSKSKNIFSNQRKVQLPLY